AGPNGAPLVVAPVSGPAGARITVTLDNIPLGEALRYIANQAGLKVKVDPYAVSIIPLSEQSHDLITKRYHVPPEFFGGPLDVGEHGRRVSPRRKRNFLAAQRHADCSQYAGQFGLHGCAG